MEKQDLTELLIDKANAKIKYYRSEIEQLKRNTLIPIAIVGIACQFPGANSKKEYWKMLQNKTVAFSCLDEHARWEHSYFSDKIYAKKAGLLDNFDRFDANLFHLSPREVEDMDPQQRFLLMNTWHLFEDAGYPPLSLPTNKIGVFIGIMNHDYTDLLASEDMISEYTGTGSAFSVAAGRISYTFGLNGPCMAIDTACSSSLLAIHEACISLRTRQCEMAIAGGVNFILSPNAFIGSCKANMLSKSDECRVFDSRADGYVRAEGCGLVLLKPLDDAIKQHDNIIAIVRGSAINQDGYTQGLTVPSSNAQQNVMRKALSEASVKPHEVSYIEAHGTGTKLGDPIESKSIQEVYGKSRDSTLYLGSVKANIGHAESAAGIAGFIKTALSLHSQTIIPQANFDTINPLCEYDTSKISIPRTQVDAANNNYHFAAVSAFSFSGTNVHIILGKADSMEKENINIILPQVFILSAETPAALKSLIEHYKAHVDTAECIASFCRASQVTRSHLSYRIATVVHDKLSLQNYLDHVEVPTTPCKFLKNSTEEIINKINSSYDTEHRTSYLFDLVNHYLEGSDIEWEKLDLEYTFSKTSLPLYSFDLQRYWLSDDRIKKIKRVPAISHKYVLPSQIEYYECYLSIEKSEFIKDHRLNNKVILAGATIVAQSILIAALLSADVHNLHFEKQLEFDEQDIELIIEHNILSKKVIFLAKKSNLKNTHQIARAEIIVNTEKPILSFPRDINLTSVNVNNFYEELKLKGLNYGPSFQSLVSIEKGNESAIGLFRAPVYFNSDTPLDELCPCLDAGFQLIGILNKQAGIKDIYIPAVVDYVEIIDLTMPIDAVTVWREEKHITNDKPLNLLSFNMVFTAKNHPVLQIRGAKVLRYSKNLAESLMYNLTWERVSSLCAITSFDAVLQQQKKLSGQLKNLFESDQTLQWKRTIDKYLPRIASNILMNIDTTDMSYEGSVKYLVNLLTELAKNDQHQAGLEQPLIQIANNIKLNYPEHSQETHLLFYCLSKMRDVISGIVPGNSVLFSPESGLSDVYMNAPASKLLNRQIGTIIKSFQSSLNEPIRILEIGAGTGATTREVIDIINMNNTTYFYSDISLTLINKAKEFFSGRCKLEYIVLDMNNNFIDQDLPSNSVDIVISANAIHAARDCRETLNYIHAILKPKGVLLLRELVKDELWLNLIFGLTPEWSQVRDAWRQTSPLLSIDKWKQLLEITGFSEINFCNDSDAVNETVIMARKHEVSIAAQSFYLGNSCPKFLNNVITYSALDDLIEANRKNPDKTHIAVSLPKVSTSSVNPEHFISDLTNSMKYVFELLQQLIRSDLKLSNIRLTFLAGNEQNIYSSPMYGLIKSLAYEHPDFCITLLYGELDSWDAYCTLPVEQILLYKDGLFYSERLAPMPYIKNNVLPVVHSGTYVIAGGLGGLGQVLIPYLLNLGVMNIVIVGRHSQDKNIDELCQTFAKASKACIRYISADLSDAKQVKLLKERLSGEQIDSIIDMVGILDNSLLYKQSWESFFSVFKTKVSSAWYMHYYFNDVKEFILFSSAAAVLGSMGQTNHSAANSFLDGLAFYRRQNNLPAISIDWGIWSSVGAAYRADVVNQFALEENGIGELFPVEGLEAYEHILTANPTQSAVFKMDWAKYVASIPPALKKYLSYCIPKRKNIGDADKLTNSNSSQYWPEILKNQLASTRHKKCMQLIYNEIKQIMRLDDDVVFDPSAHFFDQGMDSLMAIELLDRLKSCLRSNDLPSTLIFNASSLTTLANACMEIIHEQSAIA